MLTKLINAYRTPAPRQSVRKAAELDLYSAQIDLLTAQKELENWSANVRALSERVNRLHALVEPDIPADCFPADEICGLKK